MMRVLLIGRSGSGASGRVANCTGTAAASAISSGGGAPCWVVLNTRQRGW